MSTVELSLQDIYALAHRCLSMHGCDADNADAVARTVTDAERDGSVSHGLFRIPGYVASLKSGKVNGCAAPRVETLRSATLRVDGDNGFAPLAHARAIDPLSEAAHEFGVAMLAVVRVHHFAALWHETEALAARGLAALACTAYKPAVAPFGARKALFGTNPLAFSWPRGDQAPMTFDMATASMAMGEVQIAARDGKPVPPGTGLDAEGVATTDPAQIAKGGVLLPFGGHKGSAIALMIELLAAGLIGERFSFEAAEADNNDGGPPRGGEFILALSPAIIGGDDWAAHAEQLFSRYNELQGARLPGARRHANRENPDARAVNAALVEKIRGLCDKAD